MLLLLADALLLLFITLHLGIFTRDILARFFRTPVLTDILGIFLLGLATSAVYFNLVSLWFPVNYWSLVPLVILGIFRSFTHKESIRPVGDSIRGSLRYVFSMPRWPVALCVLAVLLVYSILPPYNADSAAYQYLSILWYEKFRIVPGLANLQGRFAYNPVSFIIQAAYSFTGLTGEAIYPLNRVLCGLFFLWLLMRLLRTMHSPVSLVYFALIMMEYRPMLVNIPTPTSEIMVIICMSYAVVRLFEQVLSGDMSLSRVLVPSLIILFSLIVKLSSFPLLLLLPYVFFLLPKNQRSLSLLLRIAVVCLLLYIPWLIRNYIQCGYLVYPFAHADWFHPDWKVPYNVVKFENFYLHKGYMSYSGPDMLIEQTSTLHSSIPIVQQYFYWLSFSLRKHTPLDPLIILLGLISPLYWLICFPLKKKIAARPFILWSIVYAGPWICSLIATEFRFGAPLFVLSIAFPFLALLRGGTLPAGTQSAIIPARVIQQSHRPWPALFFYVLFILSSSYYIERGLTKSTTYPFTLSDCWLYPLRDVEYKRGGRNFPFRTLPNGVKLYLADSVHNCINACMPCRTIDYGEVEMRGNKLEEGFRITHDKVDSLYPWIK